MTTKKKNIKPEESSTIARPRMLLIAVIMAGAASTWYWYKPLQSSPLGDEQSMQSRSSSVHSSQILIEPNTNDSIAGIPEAVPVYSALPEDLVGDRSLQLRPFQPVPQGTLQERLSKEPLPVIPISRPERSTPDRIATNNHSAPAVWTNGESHPASSLFGEPLANRSGASVASADRYGTDWDSASPMKSTQISSSTTTPSDAEVLTKTQIQGDRIVAIAPAKQGATQWPDTTIKTYQQGVPNKPLTINSKEIANANPMADRPQGKIALAENHSEEPTADSSRGAARRSIPTSWSGGTNHRNPGHQPIKKSGAVIKQPSSR